METRKSILIKIILASIFAALVAIGAFIQIPLPHLDYFTLQFFFVLAAGLILGSKYGAISIIVYVTLGLVGLPIFAAGGGIAYVLRPTFGYLFAFIIAAYVTGLIVEKSNKKLYTYFIAVAAGILITYSIGLTYKFLMTNLYVGKDLSFIACLAGMFPIDLPCDIFLAIVAALVCYKVNTMNIMKWKNN